MYGWTDGRMDGWMDGTHFSNHKIGSAVILSIRTVETQVHQCLAVFIYAYVCVVSALGH